MNKHIVLKVTMVLFIRKIIQLYDMHALNVKLFL